LPRADQYSVAVDREHRGDSGLHLGTDKALTERHLSPLHHFPAQLTIAWATLNPPQRVVGC